MNKAQNQKDIRWPFLLVISIVLFLLFTLNGSPSFYVDEYWIASIAARSFNVHGIINTSFRNFSPEYINVQPLYIFSLGGIIKLFGNSLFVVRLLSALSILGCAFIMVKISYKKAGYSSLFFLLITFILTLPFVWRTAHICRPEPIVLLAILAALLVNINLKNAGILFNFCAGLMLALPIYIYITGILVLPIVAYLFIREFFRDRSNKIILRISVIRVAGFAFGMAGFFLWAGTPVEVWAYLSESDISKTNVSNLGLLSRSYTFLKFYGNYQLENLFFYLPAWALIFYSLYVNGLKGKQINFCVFYAIAIGFLAFLSRKSANYLIYSEIFFVMLLVSSLVDQRALIRKMGLIYFISTGILFCIFFTSYFSGFTPDMVEARFDRIFKNPKEVVVARIPYKYYFFNNDNFLALEDFEYLLRTRDRISPVEYVQSNSIQWSVLDDAAFEKTELLSLVTYIRDNFEVVEIFNDSFMGHRIYEDVPYEWNLSAILDKMKVRPSSKIYIYRRKDIPANR